MNKIVQYSPSTVVSKTIPYRRDMNRRLSSNSNFKMLTSYYFSCVRYLKANLVLSLNF